jgi:hypothetical protein
MRVPSEVAATSHLKSSLVAGTPSLSRMKELPGSRL